MYGVNWDGSEDWTQTFSAVGLGHYDIHMILTPFPNPAHTHTHCPQSITCLVQLASVRRSLFNNVERTNFLAQLVKGVRSILEQPQVCVYN